MMQQQQEHEKQTNKQTIGLVGKTTTLHMRPGGYSGFQVTGMFEWGQNSKPKNPLGLQKQNPNKSLDQNLPPPPKIPCQMCEP